MADVAVVEQEEGLGDIRVSSWGSRRLALVDLGCAVLAAAGWYISDGRLGPWLLALAAIPWGVRLVRGEWPLKRTRFDWLLLAFLLSALVGLWASHDPAIAADKFWLIVGSLVLFYAVAGQPVEHVWPVMSGMGFFGAAVAAYFFLSHDWQAAPAKIGFINELASRWSQVRPVFLVGRHDLHPNVAGGLMAMFSPALVATAIRAVWRRRTAPAILTVGAALLLAIGLLVTTSRGAWLAQLGGLIVWVAWFGAGEIAPRLFLSRRNSLALFLTIGAGLAIVAALLAPGGLIGALDRLPGPANAGSRLEISRETIDLIGDFPFTGGGLGSFDGLYSQYIRVIPNHFLIHGHNWFLNVALEQGGIGLLMLAAVIGAAFWWLADPRHSYPRRAVADRSLLCGAIVATLVVMCLHGLVEDALYGSRAVLVMWLPIGLVAAVFPRQKRSSRGESPSRGLNRLTLGVLVVSVVGFVLLFREPLTAIVESNLGALEMARVELAGYPTNTWVESVDASALSPARARFDRAIALDPNNRTGWHRLGLIAMRTRDFENAVTALHNAYTLDPGHRGVRKALGFAYLWTGDVTQAIPLLLDIPEAVDELKVYSWWWKEQGRADLSQSADEALRQLTANSATQP